jgi:hypothetical protein
MEAWQVRTHLISIIGKWTAHNGYGGKNAYSEYTPTVTEQQQINIVSGAEYVYHQLLPVLSKNMEVVLLA